VDLLNLYTTGACSVTIDSIPESIYNRCLFCSVVTIADDLERVVPLQQKHELQKMEVDITQEVFIYLQHVPVLRE
jgi:hypothetical protein